MKNKIAAWCLASLLTIVAHAQQSASPVTISYDVSDKKDSVFLTVNAVPNTKPGTLMVTVSSPIALKTDTSFYPVIDISSAIALVIPPNFRSNSMQVKAFFYPKIFSISGQVVSKVKGRSINAMVVTDNQRLYNKALQLTEGDFFTLPALVFENKASLIFNYADDKRKVHPDVTITQKPIPSDFTNLIFSTEIIFTAPIKKDSTGKPMPGNYSINADSLDKKFKNIQGVTVTGVRKSNAEKFNEENSSPEFQDINERVIDCLDNDDVLSFPDCLTFLQTKVPGLRVNIDKMGESEVIWRGKQVNAFFIDEIPVEIESFLSVNPLDIAIIKTFPPPFTGAGFGSGNGGAIAIYTRKGEYRRPDATANQWLFSVKGYSAPIHVLFNDK
ncbi:hypothetical protein [Ferruginibacter albus]|uniref:hypothetical protein n=1 Tax=Ferruginibacter albus TaxID=2875540 RepID=UPI001CC73319|nr:hypothetical protein [Ferruginibacter albus]UAY51785.1 hypothetical protein K9M53_14465 [Ferruginibacter albus]